MNHRPITQVRRDVEEVERLLASRGWAVLADALARDIEMAVAAMAQPNLTNEAVHFRRGALCAAVNMTKLPEAVLSRLHTELAVHPDQTPPKPAKAGSGAQK